MFGNVITAIFNTDGSHKLAETDLVRPLWPELTSLCSKLECLSRADIRCVSLTLAGKTTWAKHPRIKLHFNGRLRALFRNVRLG